MPLLPCHLMFGIERGDEIRDLIETATGLPCPCVRGLRCVLLEPLPEDAKVIPLADAG
jgi:hypothetical protein